ncbi:MAG TPA: hypothetical protein VK970_16025, partial [Candidatus Methylacidiphilales bacterium]|nr:hypothetical protein [Candidatus Methylacidiphilales bacterium]
TLRRAISFLNRTFPMQMGGILRGPYGESEERNSFRSAHEKPLAAQGGRGVFVKEAGPALI